MKRRTCLAGSVTAAAESPLLDLGAASSPAPIEETHFPNRLYQPVWRNWELANLERMAQVVQTTPAKLGELGLSLGLPEKPHLFSDQLQGIYITVIRQNDLGTPADVVSSPSNTRWLERNSASRLRPRDPVEFPRFLAHLGPILVELEKEKAHD